ncbi:ATP-binding protein [Rhodovulum kholense]|uniref:AAA domain-containing protein n=1 Tax=Rhodovulum kholense TaxID=453584 RepID=A0A8E3AP83_9RHOB|nr:ATP-binding protein [Rhodovulum kholense]PTW44267.1 AAA domain-containing protein [Rhodovulum kholense]
MRNKTQTVQASIHERAAEIGRVFDTHPIDGSDASLWLRRESLERKLQHYLGLPNQHICVDGPSGTGKTSLVKKIFSENNHGLIHIQITSDMKWEDITRQFVEIPASTKRSSATNVRGVLSLFRPSLSGELRYGEEFSEKDSYELLMAKAEKWKSHDVAKWISDNDLILIIDDLELASDEIVKSIASLGKLLGQSHKGKMVLIGVNDILERVTASNPSLRHRISELTVGGLSDVIESSDFVLRKFEILGVKTPLNNRRCNKETKMQCRQMIFDAANGLLKELNSLGMTLAEELRGGRTNLSVSDVKKVCFRTVRQKRFQNKDEIRAVSSVLLKNRDYHDVFQFLLSRSASSVTYYAEVEEELGSRYGEDNIRSALEYFEQRDLVVITGNQDVRLFFKNPPLLNCIKAHLRSGNRYGWNPSDEKEMELGLAQISLGLLGGKSNA